MRLRVRHMLRYGADDVRISGCFAFLRAMRGFRFKDGCNVGHVAMVGSARSVAALVDD